MVARSAPRHRELGLDERTLQHATGVALTALADRARLTRGELTAAWEPAGIATADQRGYHLVVHLAQTGRICLGPTAPDRPATIADLARWSSLPVTEVRRGVAAVRGRLTTVAVDGVEHLMDPGTPDRLAACRDEAAQVMLLPGFDEYLLGYADRDAVLAPEHAQRLVPGRNGVFRPTVVVGGQVVATCKHVPGRRGAPATLAMECFDELDGPPAAGVERAYARLP